MSVESLRKELGDILPERHPFLDKFDQLMDPAPAKPEDSTDNGDHDSSSDYLNLLEDVVEVVSKIDDWKRGIRDWGEVERALELFQKEMP